MLPRWCEPIAVPRQWREDQPRAGPESEPIKGRERLLLPRTIADRLQPATIILNFVDDDLNNKTGVPTIFNHKSACRLAPSPEPRWRSLVSNTNTWMPTIVTTNRVSGGKSGARHKRPTKTHGSHGSETANRIQSLLTKVVKGQESLTKDRHNKNR